MTDLWKRIEEKCRIKSRKDWVIFWVFAVLIVYALSSRWHFRMDAWLRQYSNPYLTQLNEPASYGHMMIAVAIITFVVEIVLILCRKNWKIKVAAPVVGMVILLLTFQMYRINCDRIVSVIWEEEPTGASIWVGGENAGKNVAIDSFMTEEERKELAELCRELTTVSHEKNAEGTDWYYKTEEVSGNSDRIWFHYPEKYGHRFDYVIGIYDGYVFIWKGYNHRDESVLTFLEDNGVVEYLQKLEEKYK